MKHSIQTYGEQKVKQATVEIVVLRGNGDREDLGVVSYWHRNPLRRLRWRMTHWRKERTA